MKLFIREDLSDLLGATDPFDAVAGLDGEVFRSREGRRTLRISHNERSYFLKEHRGIGWGEIIKNVTQAKMPVLGAEQEYLAIGRLQEVGIATMTVAAFGEKGLNPATRHSFLITDDLTETSSLEDLAESWIQSPPSRQYREALISKLGDISRRMHEAGVNHRDFYLCHFLVDTDRAMNEDIDAPLHLIDMHRSQVRGSVPARWRIKDIAGIYFSSARYGLTRDELRLFMAAYDGVPVSRLDEHSGFWRRVRLQAEKIYRRYYESEPEFPLQFHEHPGKDI